MIAGYELQNFDPDRDPALTLQNVVWAGPVEVMTEKLTYYGNAGVVKWLWSLLDEEMRAIASDIEAFVCVPNDSPKKSRICYSSKSPKSYSRTSSEK